MSLWRDERNRAALERLRRSMPPSFPAPVLVHALGRPLIPVTPRRAVESYWRHHLLRADRLARGLAALSGAPVGWSWRLGKSGGDRDLPATFRCPPAPYREAAFARGPGHCCVCGQPVYQLGWHHDVGGKRSTNRNASWHVACVVAWKLWCEPSEFLQPLKRQQSRRCGATGRRILRDAEVDHRVPLFRVWQERRDEAWPALLGYWGGPNLQVINRPAHVAKCSEEAALRSLWRREGESDPPFRQTA